eukprot:CAMPEP_0202865750 /NCGR_PEP_ID=MMETSP1391-20130828/6334_1 /ASSEMBLY_ACC=CAM_ASM_000867 /TAXON_ID=1034604 /ORGANISM="Chlamydomonas leiostraca, Strain SAG 11-49" /LENGTH=166 /DNA_ID=CAMNT_0049545627 /DNA_START=147 /DNA_END=647 /DNA_ORIENTATION=+
MKRGYVLSSSRLGSGSVTVPMHAVGRMARRAPLCMAADSAEATSTSAPAGVEYQLTLKKPVGLVFAQKPSGGPVYVEEVTPGGIADKTGKVQVGDVLSKCSAVVLKSGKEGEYEREGYGQTLYTNWDKVMFDCEGQEFNTVMSALKSNNARWGIMDVTLVFRRPVA